MNQIEYVRKHILRVTQTEMARIAKVTQATVSRWEAGEFGPSQDELRLIRNEAIERGILWNDAVFFEPVPAGVEGAAS